MRETRRSFLGIVVGSVLGLFGYCHNAFGRWWHGTRGDTRRLAWHMVGPNHNIPPKMLASLSYTQMENWHETDHVRYGATPSRFGRNRHEVIRNRLPKRGTPYPHKRPTVFGDTRWIANKTVIQDKQGNSYTRSVTSIRSKSKKRLYVIDNKLVFK